MKNFALVFVSAIILGAIGYWAVGTYNAADPMAGVISNSPAMQYKLKYAGEKKKEKGIFGAKEWLHQIRANQNTGIVSIDDVIAARDQWKIAKQMKSQGGRSLGLEWEEMGPDNVGGRTRGIVIDPANPDRMWCGGVSGGLFYSENGGLSWDIHPWTIENDHVGVSVLRIAPNGDIYIGTGESFPVALDGVPNTFGAPGFIGSGVYRSVDGGQTFSSIPATVPVANTNADRWSFINEIAFDPFDSNKFYVSTNAGFVMTQDGGQTFTTPNGITAGLQNSPSLEVAVDPTLGTVYALVSSRVFRSVDNGQNFIDFSGQGGFPAVNQFGRIEFATTASQEGLVYACVATAGTFSGSLRGIYRSIDNGANWTLVVQGSTNGFNPLGEQAFYDIAFGIDPVNPDRLILGGQLELWSINVNGGRDLIAYWQPEIPSNPYYVHADMHVVAFHPTDPNILYIGSDGGVSRSNNAQDQFPKFTPRNKGLAITQFYGLGTSYNGYILGGTQDNGTNLNDCKNNGPLTFREVNGGDGGDGAISRIDPNISFATLYSGQLLRSVNNFDSYGCALDINIDGNSDCQPDAGSLFISPFNLWEQDSIANITVYRKKTYFDKTTQTVVSQDVTAENIDIKKEKGILFLCTTNGLWFAPNALNPSISPTWYNIPVSGQASAITISEAGTAYVGTTNGNTYRVEGLSDNYVLDSLLSAVETTEDPNDPNISIIDSTYDYFYKSPLSRANWSFPSTASVNDIASHQGIRRIKFTTGAGNRYVTGFAINPTNENQVVVTYGNYGNSNYVYQSLNANDPPAGQTTPLPQFQSIQNDLPLMPVYDAVFDFYNGNNIILGTELGVWSTSNALDGAAQISWTTENAQRFGAVPTFQVRVDPLYEMDCRVLYAGTHGRGIFRSTTLSPFNCDVTPCKDIVGLTEVPANVKAASLKVYPNPVTANANIELNITKGKEAVVMVFDMSGRMVFNQKVNSLMAGKNKLTFNLSGLLSGTYIIAAQVPGEKVLTNTLIKQ